MTKQISGNVTMGRGTGGVCSESFTSNCRLPRGSERLQLGFRLLSYIQPVSLLSKSNSKLTCSTSSGLPEKLSEFQLLLVVMVFIHIDAAFL